jgi:hypothetical protein
LGGENAIVLAEGVRGEELAAEDDACRVLGEITVDLVADLGRDGLQGVVVGRYRCGRWAG